MTTPTTFSTTAQTNKIDDKFSCITCYFYTSNRYDYNRHLLTRKHIKTQINNVVVYEDLEKTQTQSVLRREDLEKTQTQSVLRREELEKTQEQNAIQYELIQENNPSHQESHKTSYNCPNCNKPHNDRAGLWRHKKKCASRSEPVYENTLQRTEEKPHIIITAEMFMELMKQNKDLQNLLVEQNTKLVEMANTKNNTITCNTNNCNNTNKFTPMNI